MYIRSFTRPDFVGRLFVLSENNQLVPANFFATVEVNNVFPFAKLKTVPELAPISHGIDVESRQAWIEHIFRSEVNRSGLQLRFGPLELHYLGSVLIEATIRLNSTGNRDTGIYVRAQCEIHVDFQVGCLSCDLTMTIAITEGVQTASRVNLQCPNGQLEVAQLLAETSQRMNSVCLASNDQIPLWEWKTDA